MLLLKVSSSILLLDTHLHITTDGEDYRMLTTIVSVPAKAISNFFTIKIINDSITECDETLKLMLSVPALICGVVSGKTDTTEVVIKDDGKRSVSYVVSFIY